MKTRDLRLKGKTVVVAGAGLLGSEFCRKIHEVGGNLVVADFDEIRIEKLQETLKMNNREGQGVRAIRVDVTSESSVAALLEAAIAHFGCVDGMVNCVYPRNSTFGRDFFNVTYDNFCENVSMHLGGYFLMCRVFGEYFKSRKEGSIVNVASIYGVRAPVFSLYKSTGMSNPVEYSAIKSGIIHLSRYVAAYLGPFEVRVNCLSPGGVEDNQPRNFQEAYRAHCHSKGLLDPRDLSDAVVFLLSDGAKYVRGQNLVVDDGFTL